MPESGTYGSVRGVPGNRHPYRDRQQPPTAAFPTADAGRPKLDALVSAEATAQLLVAMPPKTE